MPSSLRRADLFGFVPGGRVLESEEEYGNWDPDTNVLDAEEEYGSVLEAEEDYGFVLGGPVLQAEEDYGFVPGGRVLQAEEDYGFVPGGRVLQAEEDYGFVPGGPVLEAEEEYGEDDDDIEMSDVSLFGGDRDDVDVQLDEIIDEMDHEDAFGADPVAHLSPELDHLVDPLSNVLRDGVRDSFWGAEASNPSSFRQMFRSSAEAISNAFEKMAAPGDMEEIAGFLLLDGAFPSWDSLNDQEREALVEGAVWASAWPGIDMQADDVFWEAWSSGKTSLPTSAYEVAKIALTQDLPKAIHAAFAEVQPLGIAMKAAGFNPEDRDQLRNERAMAIWVLGKFGYPIYSYMAKAITDKAQDIISEAARVSGPSTSAPSAPAPNGPISIEAERMVEEIVVVAPVQQGPAESGSGWGSVQFLAFGYGVSMMLPLLGIVR